MKGTTIVCAVKDAESATAVVRVGVELGDSFGARVVLVRVAGRHLGNRGSREMQPTRQARASVWLLLEKIASDNGVLERVDRRVETGDPSEVLARVAAEEGAAVIVVGSRDGGLRRTVLGALARRLATSAPCPVVVALPRPTRRTRA
jgi:nucleotide-binding universal stress UspA family protein